LLWVWNRCKWSDTAWWWRTSSAYYILLITSCHTSVRIGILSSINLFYKNIAKYKIILVGTHTLESRVDTRKYLQYKNPYTLTQKTFSCV
jgi:hypothetical protein